MKKIMNLEKMVERVKVLKKLEYNTICLTNGVFDILHRGHVEYLQMAKRYADILIVAINYNESVKKNKGEKRPINSTKDRAAVLAALECVDYVTIFKDPTAKEVIKLIRPHVYIKGGDYNINTIDKGEKYYLKKCKSKVIFIPLSKGYSTTNLIEKIQGLK